MATVEDDTLETLLSKITNPSNQDEDTDVIMAFCDQVNKHLEGPQIAIRLLAYKVQSPQERECLHALSTLEACVRNCGKRFHQEIGKFRFLNEMIKLVSPKYAGPYTTDKVKKKVIELLYSWAKGLKQETKIMEAYQMLKKQKIVKDDPTYIDQHIDILVPPTPEKERNSIFNDDTKSKQLQKLLSSKNPEDLQAANRLIKNMVKQDAERMEKISKRTSELETVNNNVKLLNEMLNVYHNANTAQSDREIMKELYDNLEKARPNLFRLASDADEQDNDGINQILETNDSVARVMTSFKEKISTDANCSTVAATNNDPSSLLDLDFGAKNSVDILRTQLDELGLNTKLETTPQLEPTTTSEQKDDDLVQLGDIFSNSQTTSIFGSNTSNQMANPPIYNPPVYQPLSNIGSTATGSILTPSTQSAFSSTNSTKPKATIGTNAFDDLDILGKSLTTENSKPATFDQKPEAKTLAELQQMKVSSESPNSKSLIDDLPMLIPNSSPPEPVTLDNVFVALDTIQFASTTPLVGYDKNNVRVMINFTKNTVADRPDVAVFVVSTLSTSSAQLTSFSFLAAVPKAMKIKLQPASSTSLAAFNPIVPASPITQVMLISNPNKDKIKLKYKITYKLGEEQFTDNGDVTEFPTFQL
ncbi:DgyrCDS10925 [Dimorphilus gyrociliatus]|uniref:DgyrCDS10925 n=1 Tax=Dimorphilus gyrociliatus TaxID=2664684 RepID=A0A7I8W3P9_9ANNE|nr:DgyrCDS10925 [Dimorphilus gyrociliatus]